MFWRFCSNSLWMSLPFYLVWFKCFWSFSSFVGVISFVLKVDFDFEKIDIFITFRVNFFLKSPLFFLNNFAHFLSTTNASVIALMTTSSSRFNSRNPRTWTLRTTRMGNRMRARRTPPPPLTHLSRASSSTSSTRRHPTLVRIFNPNLVLCDLRFVITIL